MRVFHMKHFGLETKSKYLYDEQGDTLNNLCYISRMSICFIVFRGKSESQSHTDIWRTMAVKLAIKCKKINNVFFHKAHKVSFLTKRH